ncbi:hypothetical protein [Fibrobacter sp.]|uniref:hypothetical protein n=1 Tax=Fibrobacter sp. TaxID=35828 RepID=UPI00388ED02C
MIRKICSITLLFLLTVVANAQVVECTYKNTEKAGYSERDNYVCEDNHPRLRIRENLLKDPSPQKYMYACYYHRSAFGNQGWGSHKYTPSMQEILYVSKPSALCNEILSNIKNFDAAEEKNIIRRVVSQSIGHYLRTVINYYKQESNDSLNLSWIKTNEYPHSCLGCNNEPYVDSLHRAWFWKDKKYHKFFIRDKEPLKGHGVTIELGNDMPNTGCKSGTSLTFLIDNDYRIVFPKEMKEYPCFDSISIKGLGYYNENFYYDIDLGEIHRLYRQDSVKDGDLFFKNIIETIAAEKKKIATQKAANSLFKKAWENAKNTPLDESVEHSIKLCYNNGWEQKCNASLSNIKSDMRYFFYLKEPFLSEQFDMETIDLGNVENKKIEFTIVMNWNDLNNWNNNDYWDEKWGSKDLYEECKEKLGKIQIEVGFESKRNFVEGPQKVSLSIGDYLVENENSHPWIKKVSIPLENFTSNINENFNWKRIEKVFIKADYPNLDGECFSVFGRDNLFPILEKNFYDIINVVIINTAPEKKVLDIDPTTCSFRNKGSFQKGLVNANNTYICSDSGWSLYSVKIGNVEVAAHNLDVGGTTFTYDNMYFEEKDQIETWNRYSRTWGHIYGKSNLQNICPDGWRLPKESDLKEIKNQVDSKQAVFPYINYSYENSANEYGCVDMYGNRVWRDTSLCEITSSKTYFGGTYIIPDDGKRKKYSEVHPNRYWAMDENGVAFVYGVDNFKKIEGYTDDINFIRCVKNTDDNIVSKEPSSENIAQRKERLKNQKQESASAAAESAKQDDDEKSSISTTKLLRIAVFSAVAVGGAAAAYMFDKKAKDATATPPANEQEFKKGHDDAKQNQNVRNISLGVAAVGLVALGISILF